MKRIHKTRFSSKLNSSKIALLGAILLSFFYSCQNIEHVYYHASSDVDPNDFTPEDRLSWNFAITQVPTDSITLSIETRHHTNYPYRNLGLEVLLRKGLETLYKDTVELTLANEKGDWLGSGWGSLYQTTHPIKQLDLLPDSTYNLQIRPLMNEWHIKGLSSIGFKLEKSNQ